MRDKYLFLINSTFPPRLVKRMDLLKDSFDIHTIYWDKDGEAGLELRRDYVSVNRIDISANRTNPMKRIVPTLKFIKQALALIKELKPRVIHVQSYDTLVIAYRYKNKFDADVKIIYEVPDIHYYLTDEKKSFPINLLSKQLKRRELHMLRLVDLIVVTSRSFLGHFEGHFDMEKIIFMPNMPDGRLFNNYAELRKKNDGRPFTVGYIGGIRYINELKRLTEAIDGTGVKLLMAGFENGSYFKELAEKKDFIEYRGKFFYDDEIAELYSKCDCIFSVYDASMENVRIALPNKLYESIFASMPIIVAKNTYLSELVKEWNIGLAVDHLSADEMREAILKLRDDKEFYNAIRENSLNMQSEFSFEAYSNRLLAMIKELF